MADGGDAYAHSRRQPWTFFALVLVLAAPFWLLSAATGFLLLPGLPVAALMVVCPAIAGALLAYRSDGAPAARALMARAFDFRRIRKSVWLVPALFMAPLVAVLAFETLRMTGTKVPPPQISIGTLAGLGGLFLVAALAEELGWSGYAIDPLQEQFGALGGALIVGLVWAIYHFLPLLEVGRSIGWVAWWTLGTVSFRVLIVWLYNNTGRSVFAAAILHASRNVCWQGFPVHGSYFDPRIDGLICAGVAVVIAAVWGPKTLSRRA